MVYAARPRRRSVFSVFRPEAARPSCSGFTLIELLVVIAIIAILAAILFPVFAQARDKARQASCLSNEKQIGSGLIMYSQDFDETLPMGNYNLPPTSPNAANVPKWMDMLYPYVKNVQVFNCPTNINNSLDYVPCTMDPTTQLCTNRAGYRLGTYGLNGANYRGQTFASPYVQTHNPTGAALADIKAPADTIFVSEICYSVFDATQTPNAVFLGGYNNASIAWDSDAFNPTVYKTSVPPSLAYQKSGKAVPVVPISHAGGVNNLFCDGHAKWLSGEALVATHTINGHNITYLWTTEDD